jgi:hypothetical protein
MQVLERRSQIDFFDGEPSDFDPTFNTRNPAALRWWLGIAVAIVASYLPLLTANFGRHNDYMLWACDTSGALKQFPEMWHLLAIGRPLGAMLLNLHFTCLGSLSDFVISRWVSLAVTLVSAWLLANHLLHRPRVPLPMAVCAAACVFLLPASQLYVSWLTNFVPGTLTVLLSLLAYRILDGGQGDASVRASLLRWRRLLIGEAVFLFALLIYPPSALFILVPAFSNLVFVPFDRWPETRRRLVRDFAFVAIGMLIFFACVRFVYLPIVVRYWPQVSAVMEQNRGGPYELRFGFNLHFWERNLRDVVKVSFGGPLHAVLGRRMDDPLAKLVGGGLLLGWIGHVLRSRRAVGSPRVSLLWSCQALLAGIGLFVLSETPSIVAQVDGIAGYRVVFPAEAMVALLVFGFFSALRPRPPRNEWTTFHPIFPIALLVACAALAFWNMRNVAASAVAELNYYRRELSTVDLSTTRQLRVICPTLRGLFLDVPLKMDFRYLGSHHDLSVPGMLKVVLKERGVEIGDLKVTVAHADGPITAVGTSAQMRTIDTSRAVHWFTN